LTGDINYDMLLLFEIPFFKEDAMYKGADKWISITGGGAFITVLITLVSGYSAIGIPVGIAAGVWLHRRLK